jgi:hypothetical protein
MLEVVDTHDEVERAVEVEPGDVAFLETAVGEPRTPGDLVGALDEILLEIDAEHFGPRMTLGELEREDPGA